MTRPKVKATRRLYISATVRAASTSFLQRVMRWTELPCRAEDPELFFPAGDTAADQPQIKQAKKVCASCPLRMTCLELTVRAEAAKRGPLHGIVGGKTADERTPEVIVRRTKSKRRSAVVKAPTTAPVPVVAGLDTAPAAATEVAA